MKLEALKINSLTLDPNNARTHDNANLEAIAGSLTHFGQRKPIVVDKNNVVVAGNGTVTAAQSLGWTDIQAVRVPDDWDADRIKAFALADNRTAELASWNPEVLASQLVDLDAVGFDVSEFGFEALEPPTSPDDDDDEPLSFEDAPQRAALGDYWRVGKHEIICDSSLDPDTLKRFGVTWDAVITDPPYGIGANKQTLGNGKKQFHRGIGWDDKTPPIAWVLDLAPKAIIWGGNYFTHELEPTNDWLIWYKKIANVSFSECEMAWTNLKKQTRLLAHHWSGEEKKHVTMKPSPVMDWCCSFFDRGAKILDVFAGSGSTLLAAHRAGQIGYGVELDPKYVDVILERLEKLTGEKAELVNASR
jgi:site-specific DNA-methyltransferase (adenine-specific)